MHRQQGFTLIELLVVIAIIGILATLVITQLSGATVKARNTSAKSDIGEVKTSVEAFKADDQNNGSFVIDSNPGAAAGAVTLGNTTGAAIIGLFAGRQNVLPAGGASYAAGSHYATPITHTPSATQTYTYSSNAGTGGALTIGSTFSKCYVFGSSMDIRNGVTDSAFYWVQDGAAGNGGALPPVAASC